MKENAVNGRGEETRRRLLDAALEAFGRHGYDAVSTRGLAEAAGVNLAAIPYHFGGKQGIYLAVAHEIVAAVGADIRPAAERLRAELLAGAPSRAVLLDRLEQLVQMVARRILATPKAQFWASFLLREQLAPGAAFDIVYEGYIRVVHETLTLLVARVLGLSPDAPEVIMRTHALIGQLFIFRMAPEVLRRRLRWEQYTPERIEQIVRIITRQMRETLHGAQEAQ